jgi:hypothetical protein
MSWDVELIDDRGHIEAEWNYTHNTNRMIAAALADLVRAKFPTTSSSARRGGTG